MTTPGTIVASADMTCRQLVELVTEYLEQALPDEERLRFERHLESCGYCRRHVDLFREWRRGR
jgi:anti-sigma factor RsiW